MKSKRGYSERNMGPPCKSPSGKKRRESIAKGETKYLRPLTKYSNASAKKGTKSANKKKRS